MTTGRIHSIETFGAADGPGIRFVVFFQGCPLRCVYCHNPDTWDISNGKAATADELISTILPYRNFYKNGGVTLSGGEPLLQVEFTCELLSGLKSHGFHTAIDTSGSVPLNRCRKAIDLADMLLLDIKGFGGTLSERITGKNNVFEHETEILRYCSETGKDVWIRYVVVPGLTDSTDSVNLLSQYLSQFTCISKVEPLPFHKLGESKWNKNFYTLSDVLPPDEQTMTRVKKQLKLM